MINNLIIANIKRIELHHLEIETGYTFSIYLYNGRGVLKFIIMIKTEGKEHFEVEKYDGNKGEAVIDDIIGDLKKKGDAEEKPVSGGYESFTQAGHDVYEAIKILDNHYIKEAINLLWNVKGSLDESKVPQALVTDDVWKKYFEQVVGHRLNEDDVKNLLGFLTRNKRVREMIRQQYHARPEFYSREDEL